MSIPAPIVKVRPRVVPTELQFWWTPPAILVAVGSNSGNTVSIAISPDGLTWFASTNSPFSSGFGRGIAWNGSYWIAVGNNSGLTVSIAKSTDGLTWTNSTDNPFSGGYGFGIAWNASYWVAVGQNTDNTVCIAKSTDGLLWTNSTDNPFSGGAGQEIAWNGSYWVAVGRNTDNTVCIATSTDGLLWTNSTDNPFSGGTGYGITWNNSYWVAVGQNTGSTVCISTSTDGLLWTDATDNPFSGGVANGIAWNGSTWVAVGNNSGYTVSIAKSTDGLLWTDASNNPFSGATGYGITWNNSYWVATGYNTDNTVCIATSTDGLTWTVSTNNPFTGGYGFGIACVNENIIGYVLECASPSVSVTTGPTDLTKTITGLTNLTDYSFTIKTDISGSYSDPVPFRTVRTSVKPQAVASLTGSQSIVNGALSITFTWTDPGDYAWYYVYGLRVKTGTDFLYDGTTDFYSLSHTFTGLAPSQTYIFHIQRGNDAGYSPQTTFTTTPVYLFDPTTVTGLNFWVDATDTSGDDSAVADGTTITTWVDKSGTTNNGTASTGATLQTDTIGRYLDFQGSSWYDLAASSWAYNEYYTIFVVDKPLAYDTNYSLVGHQSASTDSIYIRYSPTDGIRFSSQGDNAAFGTDFEAANSQVNVWCFTNYGGKRVYWNKLVSGRNNTSAAYITDSLLTIGATQAGSNPYNGRMREVLMYSGIMSESDRAAIQDYLFDKWMPLSEIPYSPPVQDGCVMWLDATDKPTLFQDLSGTIAVTTNGDTILRWNDKSGQENYMSASTGTPLYVTSGINGLPVFNTNDVGGTIETNPFLKSGDATLFLVAKMVTNNSSGFGYFEHDTSGNFGLGEDAAAKRSWHGSPTRNNNQYEENVGTPFLFYGTMKKEQLLAGTFIDALGSHISYSIEPISLLVGNAPIRLNTLDSVYYGEVMYYNRALTDAEVLTNATYLSKKWGFTLPTSTTFTPRSLTGLQLWLDSADPYTVFENAGALTIWKDRSGNGYNALPNGAPTISDGIIFDGSGQYLSLPDGALPRGDYSYYAVTKFTGDSVIVSGGSKDISGQMWVAVGSVSGIAISYNGLSWLSADNNPFSGGSGTGVAWNGLTWVAVGYNTDNTVSIAKSTDGLTWLSATNNPFPGGSGQGIAWNGSYWIVIGTGSLNIAKSSDGMTWTDASNNPFSGGNGVEVAWNGSYWVAVGNNSDQTVCIATSSDGMTWTDATDNPFSGGAGNGIAWNGSGSYWVAVGANTGGTVCIAKSTDGLLWTNSTDNPFSGGLGSGVAWNGSYWVSVGYNTGSTVCIAKSTDGLLWTASTNNPFSGGDGQGIAWNGYDSYWVAVGQNTGGTVCIATSTDGLTWLASSNNPFSGGYGYGIASGNAPIHNTITTVKAVTVPAGRVGQTMFDNTINGGKTFVAVGNSTVRVAKSTDGLLWLPSTTNPFTIGYGRGIAWNGSYFVAVGFGDTNNIAKSTDGSTWTDVSNSPFGGSGNIGYGIAWNSSDSYWVAVGANTSSTVCIATSTDGSTWTDASNNPFSGGFGRGIGWNGLTWVAVGNKTSGTVCIATSSDGMTWTDASNNPFSGGNGQGNGIAWNGSYWVAVGTNDDDTVCIAKSPDGMTWTDASNNPFSGNNGQGNGIAWNGSYWVAVGQNTDNTVCIAKSTDGMTWTNASNNPFSGAGGEGSGIAWNDSDLYWVAVGTNTDNTVCIAKSTDGMTWTASSNNPFSSGIAYGIVYAEIPKVSVLTDTNVIPGTTTVIVESLYSTNDNGKSLFLSGLTGATDTSFHFQDASNNYIGWDMSGGYMNGTIKELLVYNNKHTTAQRQQVEAYLKGRWYPNPYTPSGTSLWLDAGNASQFTLSAGNIQSWNDRSGNGNNFTQSAAWAQPIYSLDSVTGRYGVQFAANGIANGLASATSPFGATSSWSIFAVKRYDYSTDQVSELVNGNVCTAYDISGNTPITFTSGTTYVSSPSTLELQFTADLSGSTATVEIHTIPVLTSQVVDSLTYTAYYNGSTSITYPVSQAMTTNANLNIGFTGTLTPDLAGAMRGYIYELIVFNTTVNLATQEAVEGYLAWKWGIQSSLSITHPYYLAPP